MPLAGLAALPALALNGSTPEEQKSKEKVERLST